MTRFSFFRQYSILLLYAVVGLIVFSNVLANGFVWLDNPYLISNPAAQSVQLTTLFHGSALTASGYYRPMTALFLTIQHVLFNDQPLFYHATQIVFRILNTYLLYLLLVKFFRKDISCFLGFLYLVHPLNESQVAFIMASADLMYVFFGLIALHFVMVKKQTKFTLLMTFLFLFLSLITKEAGILFLCIATEVQVLFHRDLIKRYLFFDAAILVLYGGLRYAFHGFSSIESQLYPMVGLSITERLINIPKILFFYISKLFVPTRIGGLHLWTVTAINASDFYIPLLVDIVFIALLLFIGYSVYHKHRKLFSTYSIFISFVVLGFLFCIQIVPLDYTVSGRWFIIAMIGILGVIGVALSAFVNVQQVKQYLYPAGIAIICVLSILTYMRNSYWKDDVSLFNRWASIDDNFVIENWLSNAYYAVGDYPRALEHASASVGMFTYDNNLATLALVYEKTGDMALAKQNARKSFAADNYADGFHGYGTYQMLVPFFLRHNELSDADKILHQAVVDEPGNSYYWAMTAGVHTSLGDMTRAKAEIQKALSISPNVPEVQTMYAEIMNSDAR